ncbi:MAG: bifunctional ornithine acetyltransferase/N-acetylglutamate synthase [Archaeoglobaceae archaeon]
MDPTITVVEDEGITIIEHLQCCGIKEGNDGLGIVKCKGACAGVFTKNKLKAAPLLVTRENLRDSEVEGLVVNSGNANAFTGEEGVENAKRMAELLSSQMGCDPNSILVASTGVIGQQLDMNWIENKLDQLYPQLDSTRQTASDFARSITTTDKFTKEFVVKVGDAFIAGVAKGAGMIAPNMATMLSFIYTDARFNSQELQEMLTTAVDRSFNVTVVDGDTSTNDMVLLTSTGQKEVDKSLFQQGLNNVCYELAKMIARDGEGATTLLEIEVWGASKEEDAFKAARTIASSLLVKTAIFGNDPNWGRIVAALGYSGAEVDENLSLTLKGASDSIILVDKGSIVDSGDRAKKLMENNTEIKFIVDLHKGEHSGLAIGCDLSYDYVGINAEYTT